MDNGLLKIEGAQEATPDKYVSLATIKFIGGLQTQRSAYASIDTRYNSKFLGGKPDALIAGSNTEISNALTLQRRPGLLQYGISKIPAPVFFYDWQLATTNDIILIIDTETSGGDNAAGVNGAVFNYSPTNSGIYFNKAAGSTQTQFMDVVNTLYAGDGVDLYKIVGPNLLTWSNTFGTGAGTSFSINSPWTEAGVFALTAGQTDPNNGTAATQVIWGTTGPTAFIEQTVVPNYTPIAYNTFTFSVWMKETGGAQTIQLQIRDQSGTIATTTCVLTSGWVKYQVTGTMGAGSTAIKVYIVDPSSTNAMNIYGAQLEVGGPATTTQITTTKPQGVYLWGIQAPSTAPTLTYTAATGNTGMPWLANHAYLVGDTIVDSNGNLQYATNSGTYPGTVGNAAGTSGGTQPTWNTQVTGLTPDGTQNLIVQTVTTPVPAAANNASVTFASPVTGGNTIVLLVLVAHPQVLAISDTQSNTYVSGLSLGHGGSNPGDSGETRNNAVSSGRYTMYFYYVNSANAGATTINVTGGGNTGTYLAAAELTDLAGNDSTNFNSNSASASGGVSFTTGGITTSNAQDILISAGAFLVTPSVGAGAEIGTPPSGWTVVTSTGPASIGGSAGALVNVTLALKSVAFTGFYDPSWSIANPTTQSANVGITGSFKTSVGTLQWYNLGKNGAGLTTTIGYQYYYAYGNSYTGHFSDVSPISLSTGVITGQDISVTGATRTMTPSGPYSADPQSDLVALYRNTDGGGFFYQVALFGNGAAAQAALVAANYTGLTTTGVTYGSGTWSYTDTTPDVDLNTSIFAPIGLLNDLPPAGLKNLEYFSGRMWGSVANILYYNTSADNASLLGVQQNGVPSESWIPINYIPFNSSITRILAVGGGLLVFTQTDIWFLTGQNLLTGGFDPQKVLVGHGLRSYNAVGLDGSTVYCYTSDRELLCINPNSGSVEFGFPIGDYLEDNFDPLDVYIARHVSGSRDNAVFIADGSANWFRLNPNQQGASMSGEQTPVFSPLAEFEDTIGGIGAIGSMETQPGVTKLLVGQLPGVAPSMPNTPYFNFSNIVIGGVTSDSTLTVTVGAFINTWQGGGFVYSVGDLIVDSNGNVQRCIVAGPTVGSIHPTWATSVGQTTTETSGLTWSCVVYLVTAGDTIVMYPFSASGGGGTTVTGITDSIGSSYTAAAPVQSIGGGDNAKVQVWTALAASNVAYGDTITVTISFSGAAQLSNAWSTFSNLQAPSATLAQSDGTATTWSSGSLNVSASTVLMSFSTSVIVASVSAPFTQIAQNKAGNNSYIAYYYPAATASYSDEWVAEFGDSSAYGATLIAFPATGTNPGSGATVLVRDLTTFSDNGVTYPWEATIGSILLATPGKLAEADSITTELNNIGSAAAQCSVGVLLDEIEGTFENLPTKVNDPPQLAPSTSVLSNRFYLSQDAGVPTCRHLQISLNGAAGATKDEILAITVRGALVTEQS